MSGWDPRRDLARLLDALGRELVASDEPEIRAACLDDGDTIATAAQHVRELIGALLDDPDDPAADVRAPGPAGARELRARQH
jgi:hypothetical protein